MHFINNKYDSKLIFATMLAIVLISVCYHFLLDEVLNVIKILLEKEILSIALFSGTVILFVINYVKHKSKQVQKDVIITDKFGDFIDNFLGGIGYGTVISTSLTLLKGLFVQKFFNINYFAEFDGLDLFAILGVALFLLYYALMKVYDIAIETYKIDKTEIVRGKNKEVIAIIDSDDTNTD